MQELVGEQFIKGDGTPVHISEIMKSRVVLLYFSAIWCPPCTGFKPLFKKFYQDCNKDAPEGKKNVEVIYVPCEDEEEAYQEHISQIYWVAIPFADPRVEVLQDKFEVDAIPIVMLVRKDGTIANEAVKPLIQSKGASIYPQLLEMLGPETETLQNEPEKKEETKNIQPEPKKEVDVKENKEEKKEVPPPKIKQELEKKPDSPIPQPEGNPPEIKQEIEKKPEPSMPQPEAKKVKFSEAVPEVISDKSQNIPDPSVPRIDSFGKQRQPTLKLKAVEQPHQSIFSNSEPQNFSENLIKNKEIKEETTQQQQGAAYCCSII